MAAEVKQPGLWAQALEKFSGVAGPWLFGYRRLQRKLRQIRDESGIFPQPKGDAAALPSDSVWNTGVVAKTDTRLIPSTRPPLTVADFPATQITVEQRSFWVTRYTPQRGGTTQEVLAALDAIDLEKLVREGHLLRNDVEEMQQLYNPDKDAPGMPGEPVPLDGKNGQQDLWMWPTSQDPVSGADDVKFLQDHVSSSGAKKFMDLDTASGWKLLNKRWRIFEYALPARVLGSCQNIRCIYQWVNLLPVACNRPFRPLGNDNWLILWAIRIDPMSGGGDGSGVVHVREPALLWVYQWWIETMPSSTIVRPVCQWQPMDVKRDWFFTLGTLRVPEVPFVPSTVLAHDANSWWKIGPPLDLDNILNWAVEEEGRLLYRYEWLSDAKTAERYATQLLDEDDIDLPLIKQDLLSADVKRMFTLYTHDGGQHTSSNEGKGFVHSKMMDHVPAYAPDAVHKQWKALADANQGQQQAGRTIVPPTLDKPEWVWYLTGQRAGVWLQHCVRNQQGKLVEAWDYRLLFSPSQPPPVHKMAAYVQYPLQLIGPGWFELRRVQKWDATTDRREVTTDTLGLWALTYSKHHRTPAGSWLVNRNLFPRIPKPPFGLHPRSQQVKRITNNNNEYPKPLVLEDLVNPGKNGGPFLDDLVGRKHLGGGAYGDVYKAKVNRQGWHGSEFVAVKLLHDLDSFQREKAALSKMAHDCNPDLLCFENAIRIEKKDSKYSSDDDYYVITEYLDGYRTLYSWFRYDKQSSEHLYAVAKNLLAGLRHMHSLGVDHNDIKPENIMVHPVTRVTKLIDFGYACVGPNTCGQLKNEAQIATIYYTAPEMLNTKASTRDDFAQGDIWSLGMVLYDLIAPMHQPYWQAWLQVTGFFAGDVERTGKEITATVTVEMKKRRERAANVAKKVRDGDLVDEAVTQNYLSYLAPQGPQSLSSKSFLNMSENWDEYKEYIYQCIVSMLRFDPTKRQLPVLE